LATAEAKHKRAEEVLRKSENRFKLLLDNTKEIILILSKRGKILFANKAIINNFGYSEEEIVGKSITNFLTKDSIRRSLYALAQEFLGHPQPEMEVKARTKFGEIRYLKVARGAAPIYDKGKLIGVMVCGSDITALRKTEVELREKEKRFRELWDNAPVAYHTLDINGNITAVNQTEVRMFGYTKEEMVGKSIFEFILPEQRAEALERFQQKISGKHIPRAGNGLYVRKDGSKIYVAIEDELERDSSGKIIGIRTAMIDITQQKQAQEGLVESEARYKDLVEKAGIAILIDDKEGNFKYLNERYAEIFGYSAEEMKRQTIGSIVHPDDFDKVMNYHKGRIQGYKDPSRYEFKGIKKDGSIIHIEVIATPLKKEEEIIGTRSYFWDITDRKRAEEEIQQSMAKLRKLLDGTINAIVSVVEARDPYTSGHQRRVADLARTIAAEMRISKDQIEGIRSAGVIHDLGKVCVPAEILSKPSKLNEYEFNLIKKHPEVGYEILKNIDFPWPVAQIVYQHHERMNGSGYPQGLSGEQILLEARILAVADVVEAMSSHRPYRPAFELDEALKEISRNKGILYDKAVVEVCIRLFKEKNYKFRA